MGLDIAVGWLAQAAREEDPETFAELCETYVSLNEILLENRLAAHSEPLDIAEADVFEAQMWGDGGLHSVRRLGAYWALKGRLPTTEELQVEASEDPVLNELYAVHDAHGYQPKPKRRALDFVTANLPKPRYQHLLCHSDCEGFYVPQSFDLILFDEVVPPRTSIGGMVGSSVRLLEECRELASVIELPPGIDPDAEGLWEAANSPVAGGAVWQAYGVEAFCLARLIHGCERSLRLGAVLVFT